MKYQRIYEYHGYQFNGNLYLKKEQALFGGGGGGAPVRKTNSGVIAGLNNNTGAQAEIPYQQTIPCIDVV